jgi:broad specificity phosphatase PhoE
MAWQDAPSLGPGEKLRRLYLVRHGDAAAAVQHGPGADPWLAQLTPFGRAQIAEVAAGLAGCRLDLLVTSAVPRALETAAILVSRIELEPVVDEGLNELQPGKVLAGSPETVRHAIRQAYRLADQPGARFLDGELFTDFSRRVEQSLARILAKPTWTRAAVVTHEPVLRYVLARCRGLGLAALDAFAAKTGSVLVLEFPPSVVILDGAIVRLVDGTGSDALRLG